MTDELKPCPFCGGKATYAKAARGWKVECEGRMGSCTMNARTHYQPHKFLAIAAWNTRADLATPAPAVKVKALVWQRNGDHHAGGYGYVIRKMGSRYTLTVRNNHGQNFETIEAAKAAAQAYHDGTILAALEPSNTAADRIDELEAKLAKAVETISLCRKMQAQFAHTEDPLMVLLDTTIAELKGQDDE